MLLRATWTNAGDFSPTMSTTIMVHDVTLHVAAPPASFGQPGETVAYRNQTHAFSVSNRGDATEDVILAVETEAGHAVIEGDSVVTLEPGQTWRVAVRHDLPNPAGARTQANLTLLAFAGPLSAGNTTSTRILDFDAPMLKPVELAPRWNLGPAYPLPLSLRTQDNGATTAANATVVAPSGNRTVVALSQGADGIYHGATLLLEPGNHTIRFAAQDHVGNSAQSAIQVVEATHLAAPLIRLEGALPGGNLTNRILRLSVTAALEVNRLHVEIRQHNDTVQQDIPLKDGNFSLDLSEFEAGLIQLLVTGADASGAVGQLETTLFLSEQTTPIRPPAHDTPSLGVTALLLVLVVLSAFFSRNRR